jgi:DNA-binding GntR family transcriptional regulator
LSTMYRRDKLSSMRLDPLDQRTTPEGVHKALRDAMLDGRLPALEQLREAHIAADLGVSRAPVREALTRLEREGLIVKIPFRGAYVAEVSPETVHEIATLRYLVEPYAADLAAPRLRGSDRHRLVEATASLRAAAEAGDLPASIDAHLLFHRLFYECSGNASVKEIWDGWESKLRLFLTVDHRSYENLTDLAEAHEHLAFEALNEDPTMFRNAIAHHLHIAPGESLDDGPLPPHP